MDQTLTDPNLQGSWSKGNQLILVMQNDDRMILKHSKLISDYLVNHS